MKHTATVLLAAAIITTGMVSAATTTITFDNGLEGFGGPQGPGGTTGIEPTGGNPDANLHTVFNNFGIEFRTDTNTDFLGDFTGFEEVTFCIDVNVIDISFFGTPAPRDLILELRDTDSPPNGFPWVSVWYTLTTMTPANPGWMTYCVTIDDPTSLDLPPGWGGTGAENPDTFEPELPADRTFASVLASVDETAFSTFVPGFFFGFTDFDIRIDNIEVRSTLPCPADCAPAPNGNGTVNFDDLVAVINAISTQDLDCDVAPDNGDGTFGNGVITFDDILAVINAFGDCP